MTHNCLPTAGASRSTEPVGCGRRLDLQEGGCRAVWPKPGRLRPGRPEPRSVPATARPVARDGRPVPGQHHRRRPATGRPHARPPVSLPRDRRHSRRAPRPSRRPAHRLRRHERRRPRILPGIQRSLADQARATRVHQGRRRPASTQRLIPAECCSGPLSPARRPVLTATRRSASGLPVQKSAGRRTSGLAGL
jgi:hypothetical protein